MKELKLTVLMGRRTSLRELQLNVIFLMIIFNCLVDKMAKKMWKEFWKKKKFQQLIDYQIIWPLIFFQSTNHCSSNRYPPSNWIIIWILRYFLTFKSLNYILHCTMISIIVFFTNAVGIKLINDQNYVLQLPCLGYKRSFIILAYYFPLWKNKC